MASKLRQPASWLGRWAGHLAAGKPSPLSPRAFPTSGFLRGDASTPMEEERMESYRPEHFYPVRLGEVFQAKYQVVAKLGFDSTSTTWLGRDLYNRNFVSIKVSTNAVQNDCEADIYEHMEKHASPLGPLHIRPLEDAFKVQGPHGSHDVLVQMPLAKSMAESQATMAGGVLGTYAVKEALKQVLPALHFLHADAHVIHTSNLIDQDNCFSQYEGAELKNPSPRKVLEDRSIYTSQTPFGTKGPVYLCNFGQARIGPQASGTAMPASFRAPEIILGMRWSYPVDMWSVGLSTWDMLQPRRLFRLSDPADQRLNPAHRLASMIALLGPPPLEYLKRSDKYLDFWDESGDWRGIVPIPQERTLEYLSRSFESNEHTKFLDFIRALLGWVPEKRLTAEQALAHPWLSE